MSRHQRFHGGHHDRQGSKQGLRAERRRARRMLLNQTTEPSGCSKAMRVSHVCPFLDEQMGGTERYVANIIKVQSKHYDVHVYTTTCKLQKVGTTEWNGATVHRFYSPMVLWNINPIAFIFRSLIESNPDILHVHSHLYTTSNQAALMKKIKRSKVLLQLHGGVGPPPFRTSWTRLAAKQFYDASLGKFTIKNSDIVASVSKSDLDYVARQLSIPEHRLRYLPNAVDTDVFKPRVRKESSCDKTLLYVGDLEPWKGVGLLMKWIRQWKSADGDGVRIRFVGQGSYLPELRKMQEDHHKGTNGMSVEVLGPKHHSEIPGIMNEAAALVFTSYWEGMPTVILEAMSSGVPVISTPVGAVPDVISNMETGLLIDRSLESFQEAVTFILNDVSATQRIRQNARAAVEQRFSLAKAGRALQEVYSDMCS